MNDVLKRILGFCFACFFLLPGSVFARTHDFPNGVLIGDEEGIMVTRDGRYFIAVEDVCPGDQIRKTLVICNNEPGTSFYLATASLPLYAKGSRGSVG